MRTTRPLLSAIAIAFLSNGASSCLPADTRPPPAAIAFALSPNDASQTGITTMDGWTLHVDRLFVVIGDTSVGDACINYSDSGYGRLLDATKSDDQKISLLYALGQCDMDFRIAGPASDTLVGEGVSEADALVQGQKGTDKYVTQSSSVSVRFAATATRGATSERLDWSFRQRIRYRNCETPVDGKPAVPLDFQSNANMSFHIVVHPEALLRDDTAASSEVRFDSIASADVVFGNGDGEITLDELGGVSLDEARKVGPYGIGDADPTAIHSLEDYVYLVLLPTVPEFRESVVCKPTLGRMVFD